jgi:hypothetical protein
LVSGLHEELDRALRTLPVGEPPVERARREGGRLRARRRAAAVGGALALVAAAACYPALPGRSGSAPPAPAIGPALTPSPSKTLANGDAVVTDGPAATATMGPGGMTDKSGLVAQGTVAGDAWQVSVTGPGRTSAVLGNACATYTYTAAISADGGCVGLPSALLTQVQSGDPAGFTGMADSTTDVTVGFAADDVTYFIVTFSDGQRLKLLPVTVSGHRYVAWVVPAKLLVATVEAHLGGPYNDSGQVVTAVPFAQPDGPPMFGLWQKQGQSAPPRDTGVIGAGRSAGQAWKATADEGPWGTCVSATAGQLECVPVAQLTHTGVLGSLLNGGKSGVSWGSAAPGVTKVRVTLSTGATVEATPVGVGNEDLFAFWAGSGTDASWTAYDAAGKEVGHGTSG